MHPSASHVDLLIVGAGGPAGPHAGQLIQQWMSTRIIDRTEARTKTGHTDGLQSWTLEILESFDIVNLVLKNKEFTMGYVPIGKH